MKTYCKDIDILDYDYMSRAYDEFWKVSHNKGGKFNSFFKHKKEDVIKRAKGMILDRKLTLSPIRHFKRVDPVSMKVRDIGVESPMMQYMDHIAVNALEPLLKAKVGYHQCASVKDKGQKHAKRYISRWVNCNREKYFVKLDIRKYYPNVDIEVLMSMLRRDVKNDTLLWLIESLFSYHGGGMSIGSLLSQRMSNYYLSECFREVSNKYKVRGRKKYKWVDHVLTYADDWLLIGRDKRCIKQAVSFIKEYLFNKLHLTIKDWKICRVGKEPIDMVGYRFEPGRVTIRKKIFRRLRRAYMQARRSEHIGHRFAARCISYWGYLKRSDTLKYKRTITKLFNLCRGIMSKFNRKEQEYGNQLFGVGVQPC